MVPLLAHARCIDASEEQNLNILTKAQKLQSRMQDSDRSDLQIQTQLSLDLFLAKITDARGFFNHALIITIRTGSKRRQDVQAYKLGCRLKNK